ncbi:tellurite resistance TerB family protein [Stutzerimonas urumqiensis]|uniref:tellurite resistance TerB family protein n=1 Tax=Stutzerimonas urumqiensis TaxID=638269 RepID=UPI000EAF7AB1|nr:tellurite resistance TerB family protein [Stutzerimonas urumqiensis]
MKTRGLLDQLLKSGQSVLQQQARPGSHGGGLSGGSLSSLLSGKGGNALAASAMGMLLGGRKTSRLGGKAAKYGGLATLGMLAYKAYSAWQAQQASAPQGAPQTVDRVSPADQETHSQAVLKALVAAAKADGHVDDQERQQIEAQMAGLTDEPELRRWLQAELNKPLDPADVAAAAKSPEMAAEMYLVSLMATDEDQYMERAYLDELARQLRLDPALKRQLEDQARSA